MKINLQESHSGVENVDGTPESQVTTREPNVQDDGVSLPEAPRVDEEVQQRRQRTAAIVSGTDVTRPQLKGNQHFQVGALLKNFISFVKDRDLTVGRFHVQLRNPRGSVSDSCL